MAFHTCLRVPETYFTNKTHNLYELNVPELGRSHRLAFPMEKLMVAQDSRHDPVEGTAGWPLPGARFAVQVPPHPSDLHVQHLWLQ